MERRPARQLGEEEKKAALDVLTRYLGGNLRDEISFIVIVMFECVTAPVAIPI